MESESEILTKPRWCCCYGVDINVDTDVDVGAENYQNCDCVKSLIQKLLMVFLLPMPLVTCVLAKLLF